MAAGSEEPLRRLVREYFHTSYGERAANHLGALAFDRGAFLEAAHYWERLYRFHRRGRPDKPIYLIKAALSCHLAGVSSKSLTLRKLIEERHPAAAVVIAGKRVQAARFLQQALEGHTKDSRLRHPPVAA